LLYGFWTWVPCLVVLQMVLLLPKLPFHVASMTDHRKLVSSFPVKTRMGILGNMQKPCSSVKVTPS
jgi:hypothetical protein